MKIQKAILTETLHISIGIIACDIIMCVIFAVLGKFDYTVLLGALFGSVFAVGNFFLLGLTVQNALKKKEDQKKLVRVSYSGRMLLCAVGIVLGILLPCFNTVAAIVPFLMPQPVILAMRALGIYNPDEDIKPDVPSTDEPWIKDDAFKEGDDSVL